MTAVRTSGGTTTTTPRPGFFSIVDYPNIGDPTDDAIGLRAAFNACIAAGGGVIQLENKAGGYNLRSNGAVAGAALVNPDNSGVEVNIQGRGTNVTFINLWTPLSTLITINPLIDNVTYSPINCRDFTLDGTHNSASLHGILYFYTVPASGGLTYSTTGRIYVERVNIRNFGHTTGFDRNCIFFGANRPGVTASNAGTQGRFRGLHVTDCDLDGGTNATTRGAGIGGISVGCFVNGTSSFTDFCKTADRGLWKPSRVYSDIGPHNAGNIIYEDLVFTNVSHSSAQSPLDQSAPGYPIQIGGECVVKSLHIKGGHIRNSGDIGIEADGVEELLIEGVTFRNCDGNNVLIIPLATGRDSDQHNFVVRDCNSFYDAVDEYGTTNPLGNGPSSGPFSLNTRFGGVYNGTGLWENITVRYNQQVAAATTMISLGPARKQTIRNCRVILKPSAQTNATFNALVVHAVACSQELIVENLRVDRDGPVTNGCADGWIGIWGATDLKLTVRGLHGSTKGVESGTSGRNFRAIYMPWSDGNPTESFTTDQLEPCFIFDSGAPTNYTFATPTYTAASNLSTENRAFYVASLVSSGADQNVCKVKDGSHYSKMATPATRTGYKGGAFGKRSAATTYLEAYIYDDGTNTYLCLDKVTAGVRATLLPAAGGTATGAVDGGNLVTDTISGGGSGQAFADTGLIITRVAASSTHYPAILVVGDTVTAEHWVSAEPTVTSDARPVGSGDAWCSATLTGTDVYTFGSRMLGEFGFSQIPALAGATLGKQVHRRRHVISGSIEGLVVDDVNKAKGGASVFYHQPQYATKVRVDGSLLLQNCDFRNAKSSTGTVKDFDVLTGTDAFMQNVIRRNNQFVTPTADVTVTFVSTTPWQNQTGSMGTLTIQGGTVTKIELSKDNSTYRDTGVTTGAFRVAPNWWVKVTHSGAPTAIFTVED